MVRHHIMEIVIYDIPESGQDLSFETGKHVWFARVVKETLGESFAEGDTAELKLHLELFDDDVDITGEFCAKYHPACDRCLERVDEDLVIPIRSHMTPLYENKRQCGRETGEGADVEVVKEDLEFSYYEGDCIHLDDFIHEQIVLAQPMKHLCSENCKGLCPRCGANLNDGPCDCKGEYVDPRWKALKNVKIVTRDS